MFTRKISEFLKNLINLCFEDLFIIYHQYLCVTYTVDPNPPMTKKNVIVQYTQMFRIVKMRNNFYAHELYWIKLNVYSEPIGF